MHRLELSVTARCHCGQTQTAYGQTPGGLARALSAAGWRLVWTAHALSVWGCSTECSRRLLPAVRCEIERGETVTA